MIIVRCSYQAILQEEKEKLRQNTDDRVKELEVRLSRQEFRAEKFEDADFSIQKLTGLSSFALMKSIFYDFLGGGNDNFSKTIEYKSRSDGKYPNRKNTGSHRLNNFNQYFLPLFNNIMYIMYSYSSAVNLLHCHLAQLLTLLYAIVV